jgi:hypothetical protein
MARPRGNKEYTHSVVGSFDMQTEKNIRHRVSRVLHASLRFTSRACVVRPELLEHATKSLLYYLIAGGGLIGEKQGCSGGRAEENIANGAREILACYFATRKRNVMPR